MAGGFKELFFLFSRHAGWSSNLADMVKQHMFDIISMGSTMLKHVETTRQEGFTGTNIPKLC
jgi:tRNA pseudouridine-54 N-methylase